MKKLIPFVCLSAVLMLLVSSCSYRPVSVMPEEIRNGGIALGSVTNLTQESLFLNYVRNAFVLEMNRTPGMKLLTPENAEYLLDLRICSMNTGSVVSAEVREGVDDDNDDTAYQTILHEENLEVEYALYRKDQPLKKIRQGVVRASVVMPAMHDREVMLRSANQKVSGEAARKLVNVLTENW